MSSVSPAGQSFSSLAWIFKFPKCSDLEINQINLSSKVRMSKHKVIFFEEWVNFHAYKCVIIHFVLIIITP
jgi:hypothetical protein